jgi:hypothetical protein
VPDDQRAPAATVPADLGGGEGGRGRRAQHSRYAGGQRAEAQHLSAICHGSSSGSAGDRRRASLQ